MAGLEGPVECDGLLEDDAILLLIASFSASSMGASDTRRNGLRSSHCAGLDDSNLQRLSTVDVMMAGNR